VSNTDVEGAFVIPIVLWLLMIGLCSLLAAALERAGAVLHIPAERSACLKSSYGSPVGRRY
jgi:hypothetical protein